jgi:type III secretion system FlhB-like substrate exporter
MGGMRAMSERNDKTLATKPAAPAAPAVTAAASELGPVARQLLSIAEDRGLVVTKDADPAALVTSLKLDSPIPVEALVTVSSILIYLFEAEARFTGGRR